MDSLDELLADLHSATSTMKVEQGHSSSNVSSSSSNSLPTQVYHGKHRPFSNDSEQYLAGSSHGTSPRAVHFNDPKLTTAQPLGRHDMSGEVHSSSNSSRRDSDRYSVDSGASGDGFAPPLPPPPSQDVIDEVTAGYTDEPLYEPQNVLQSSSGHSPGFPVSHGVHYHSAGGDRGSGGYYPAGGDRGSGGYYPAAGGDGSSGGYYSAGGDRGSGGHYPAAGGDGGSGGYYPAAGGDRGSDGHYPPEGGERGGAGQTGGQSSLGANLNELDYLLQDLNSAQFMEEIGSSASDNSMGNLQSSASGRAPPPTLPKPVNSRSPLSSGVTMTASFDAPDSHPGAHASSATRELEDLMDSLSQFKVEATAPVPAQAAATVPAAAAQADEPPYAQVDKTSKTTTPTTPSKPSELDNMLGNLESDMRGHGVSVSTKGLCGACAKPIVGQVITALGRIWHPAHFCCDSCKSELGTKSFFERDEMPYCEECYHRLFAPLCGKCNTPILDKCVTAMDTTWHMECFVCEHCDRMLNDEGFHERGGLPYCRRDYLDMFAPKCGGCHQPIIEDFISTLNTQWHPQCFRCKECGATLAGGSFFDHDGLPYCETHYYAKRGSLCAGCQKPITGRCITAMFRKFHPEHFTCAFCLKQLNKGTFKEQNDKPYCHPCFVKLFA